MSGKNASYNKGYRLEAETRAELSKYGRCDRSHQSGAYTGQQDLKWLWRFRFWEIQCKAEADGFKTDYKLLEKADIIVKRADRKPRLYTMTESKFLEMIGATESELPPPVAEFIKIVEAA